MLTLHSLREALEEIGVSILTGESDGTNMGQLLCDMTEGAAMSFSRFLGGTFKPVQGGWWNEKIHYKGESEPSYTSVMMTMQTAWEFVIHHYLQKGCIVYYMKPKQWAEHYLVFYSEAEEIAFFDEHQLGPEDTFKKYYSFGTAGTRNTHQISGRVS